MRALGANHGQAKHGILTDRPGALTNDFFVNLLSMDTEWKVSASEENVYEGRARGTEQRAGRAAHAGDVRAHRRGSRSRA